MDCTLITSDGKMKVTMVFLDLENIKPQKVFMKYNGKKNPPKVPFVDRLASPTVKTRPNAQ